MTKERRTGSALGLAASSVARARLARAAGLLLWVVYVVAAVLGGKHAGLELLLESAFYGVLLISACLCLMRGFATRVERGAWLLLGAALLVWVAGFVAFDLVVEHASNPSYPSIADAFWLAFYPLAYAGLGLLMRARLSRFHSGLWLDGLLGVFALGAVGAAVVVPPILRASGSSEHALLTSLAYPGGDLVLLAFLVGFVALSGWRTGRSLTFLLVALAVHVVTDTVYSYEVATAGWQPAGLLDAGWLAAALLLAGAAWQAREPQARVETHTPAALALPGFFTLISLGVLIYCGLTQTTWLATTMAALALVVAVVRFALTQHEARQLATLARQDPLTGLLNHREFHEVVARELDHAERQDWPLSVALFDLDGFKLLNDSRGHAEGDRVLREVAEALTEISRFSDTPCRVGGDEFAIVLPHTRPDDAKRVAERVVGVVAALDVGVGISYGIGSWPTDGPTKELLLLRADVALYAAKRETTKSDTPASVSGAGEPPPEQRELERAQLLAYAEDVRTSYARGLRHAEELRASYFATVQALSAAVEAKDDYTGRHIQRVHDLGLLLATTVAPDEVDDPQMAYGFLLHDIGKLAVPDAVLTKPGRLNPEEWALIRKHPEAGAAILSAIPFLDGAVHVVLHHHERWDGKGYPHGLAGEQIPLWARIFSIVDTVDAITSDRPYSTARPLAAAIEEVLRSAGTQFDPACAEAFAGLDPAGIQALLERRAPTTRPGAIDLAGLGRISA